MKSIRIISSIIISFALLLSTVIYVFAYSYAVGDLNSDGLINITDVTVIQKYLTNMCDLNENTADFNCDGKVNISDCTIIQKYIAGQFNLYNGYMYTTSQNGNGKIIGYNGFSTTVRIPSQIQNTTITSIGDSAFMNNKKIISVSMPNSIESVGYYAFANCTSLEKVTIKNPKCHIDSSSFEGCTSLRYFVQG